MRGGRIRGVSRTTAVITAVIVVIIVAIGLVFSLRYFAPPQTTTISQTTTYLPQTSSSITTSTTTTTVTKPIPIKLGILLDFTGNFASCAEQQEKGVLLAIRDANSWGNVSVTYTMMDSQSRPDVALSLARQLASQGVDVIMGTCIAGAQAALANLSKILGIPYEPLAVLAFSAFRNGTRPGWTFAIMANPWSIGYAACKYAVTQLHAQRIFFVERADAWGSDQLAGCQAALEKYGGEIIGIGTFVAGTPDFTPLITKALSENPDIVISTTFAADQVLFVKQFYELGGLNKTKLFITWWQNVAAAAVPPEALAGVYGLHFYYWNVTPPIIDNETYKYVQQINNEFMQAYNEPPDAYSLETYLETLLTIKVIAILKSRGLPITQENFQKVLSNITMMTPKGPLEIRIDGEAEFEYGAFVVVGKPPSERTGQWDLFNVIDVIPGNEWLPPLSMLGYTST